MVVSMVSLFSDLFTTKWNDTDLRQGGERERERERDIVC